MSLRPLMVLGCTSDAGKSLLATALCRWFARRGVGVAPFKAQNMSNNARVVAGSGGTSGGEIGVAQWLQARAAGVEPDVRMNPVLVKPEADTQSQVVIRGRADRRLSAVPWRDRHDALWEPMTASFDELAAEFELVVIEGAGSPAEINLRDQVNNRMVEYADAASILVSDIDRGGSFAHLFGTWSLVPDATRERLHAFVLNRFRGDASLLEPGPRRLAEMTGMAALGVLPMLEHDLPREEGAVVSAPGVQRTDAPTVVLPRFPFGSNLDEFQLLSHAARVAWVDDGAAFEELDPARDLIVLPGSKHVRADLQWLQRRGLADAITRAAGTGVRVIGVCGGAMMLGRSFHDPSGVEGGETMATPVDALGLLDLRTVMAGDKLVVSREVDLDGNWWDAVVPATGHRPAPHARSGYEIRFGEVSGAATVGGRAAGDAVAWADGLVAATTVHGLFEHPDVVEAIVGPSRSGLPLDRVLDTTFDLLADAVDDHLDTELLLRLVQR